MKAVLAFLLMVMPRQRLTPALAAPMEGTFSDPAMEARARNLQRQLRCLVCAGENIDESGSPFSADVRRLMREQIAAGQSDQQIEDFLVARYGDVILMKPPVQPDTWLLWLAPFLALGAGRRSGLGGGQKGCLLQTLKRLRTCNLLDVICPCYARISATSGRKDWPQGAPMQNDNPKPESGLFSRLPKPSLRQRRLAAMSGAAAIVLVGLGAFALLPPVRAIQVAGTPTMVAANESETRAPRMLENSAPFSFADLVERGQPGGGDHQVGNHHHRRTKAMPTISPRRSATCSTSSARAARSRNSRTGR